MPASNAPLIPFVSAPVLDNFRRLDGGGTPTSTYIYSGGGVGVTVVVAQRDKGKITLCMYVDGGSGRQWCLTVVFACE